MGTTKLGIAAGSKRGAEAAQNVARQGGNAVDACLAATITGWVAEPFFTSIGGSGFIAVRSPDAEVEIIDGNNGMPWTQPREAGQGLQRVFLPAYADGIYVGVGAGSVGVPGVLAAIRLAWERHGAIEWPALFEYAIQTAREGFPFPKTSAYYLSATWDGLWSQFPVSESLFSSDGEPLLEDAHFVQPLLAEALEVVAEKGPDVFYKGELAQEIEEQLADGDGFLTVEDLSRYTAEIRSPVSTNALGLLIESNPPPAVGGAVLTHMLALLDGVDLSDPLERLRSIVEAQRAAVGYRREKYQDPTSIAAGLEEALEDLRSRPIKSPSTTHSSAADSNGYACSMTASNGYGAGLVVHGMLLNDTLGEEELNPLGVHSLPPGARCHSNQTPTIATGKGTTVALGSPGADRIVTAITQTLIRIAVDGDTLADAVAAPRAHLDLRPQGETLCFEPGLPGDQLPYIPRPYDETHMYFGAVQAASIGDDGHVEAAHDPRRSGGSAVV